MCLYAIIIFIDFFVNRALHRCCCFQLIGADWKHYIYFIYHKVSACVRLCVNIYILCFCVCARICTWGKMDDRLCVKFLCVCMFKYLCLCSCVYARVYVCVYARGMHGRLSVYQYVGMFVLIYLCVCVLVCVRVYVCVYTWACMDGCPLVKYVCVYE